MPKMDMDFFKKSKGKGILRRLFTKAKPEPMTEQVKDETTTLRWRLESRYGLEKIEKKPKDSEKKEPEQ